MKLIFNADDYGSTKNVVEGILECMKEGVVTDTTFLVNSPYFDYAVRRAREENITSMGLHLALTYRAPILSSQEVPSLVDEEGNFYPYPQSLQPHLKLEEVEKEWRAQIKKFQSSGLELTHLDSHHHVHINLGEGVGAIAIKLANELGVPIRRPDENQINLLQVPTTDIFGTKFGGSIETSTTEFLISYLNNHKDFKGSLELMTHPGYSDDELRSLSSWNDCREEEIKTLKDSKLKEYIKKNGIELISFKDLV